MRGLKRVKDITITGTWVTRDTPTPASTCKADPCSWCGGCIACKDFHFYKVGHGCTEDTCPLLKQRR